MEAESARRSLRRKPLSDCTNTIVASKSILTRAKRSSAKSTVIKPLNPPSNVANHQKNNSSSIKSNTGAGSNNSSNVPSVPASPLAPHPRPDSGSHHHEESGPASIQINRKDACTRKNNGKMVAEDPIVQCANDLEKSGSTDCQIQTKDAKTGKDKGKMVLRNPMVDRDCGLGHGPLVSHRQRQNASTRKDKGRMAVEDTPNKHDDYNHGSFFVHTKKQDEQRMKEKMAREHPLIQYGGSNYGPSVHTLKQDNPRRKDKGKIVATDHTNGFYSRKHEEAEPTIDQISRQDEQSRKGKGKMVADGCFNELPHQSTPCSLSVQSASIDSAPSHLSTPHDAPPILYASSGTVEQKKPGFQTIHALERASQERGCKVISCPPVKRKKELGDDYSDKDGQSGSLTDPIPWRKKKRSNSGSNEQSAVHGLPQDEVEKLRAYYAEVDAFDLPEEVASDND